MSHPYTVDEIADFLRQYAWTIVSSWDDETLFSHIKWFDAIGGLGRVYRGGKLVGVAMARLVDDPETAKFGPDLHHNEKAPAIFVDLTAAVDQSAFKGLIHVMQTRFGRRLVIAFNRKKYEGRLRIYNWQHFTMKAR